MKSRKKLIEQHEKLKAHRKQVQADLLKIPGVHAVGIGLKQTAGKLTDEGCIVVIVKKKKALSALPKKHVIPSQINGIKTDVQEKKKIQLEGGDSVQGGIKVTNAKFNSGASSYGTLGCIATRTSDDKKVLVCNQHVLYANGGGDGDSAYLKVCCCCGCHKVGKIGDGQNDDHIDCAVAELLDDVKGKNTIKDIGDIKGVAAAVLGEEVRKSGAKTGYTEGTVVTLIAFTHNDTEYHEIEINPTSDYERFSDSGDSGSVVVNSDTKIIGLHYAGTVDAKYPSHSHDIQYTASIMGLTIPAADTDDEAASSAPVRGDDWQDNPEVKNYETILGKADEGMAVLETVKKHIDEVGNLINTNRPCIVAWHRNQGPAFIEANNTTGQNPDQPFTKTVNGVTIHDLIENMADVLQSNGSNGLANDVKAYLPMGLSVAQECKTLNDLIFSPMVRQVIQSYLHKVNDTLPVLAQKMPIDLFGKKNNRLDPMDFNGQATAKTSGSFCLPQVCHKILSKKICFPPIKLCAEGSASAGLNSMSGLSTLHLDDFTLSNITVAKGNIVTAEASTTFSAQHMTGAGSAEAKGGPEGFAIPVKTSASAGVNDLRVNTAVTVVIDANASHIQSFTINTLNITYTSIDVQIGALGPFNELLSPLVNALRNVLKLFFNVDGVVSKALKGALQQILNDAL